MPSASQPASPPASQPASQAQDRLVLSTLGLSGPFFVCHDAFRCLFGSVTLGILVSLIIRMSHASAYICIHNIE